MMASYCRSVFPKLEDAFSELNSIQQPSPEMIKKEEPAINVIDVDEETLSFDLDITDQDDRTMEDWKQLVVNEDPKLYSPSCLSIAKVDHQSSVSLRDGNRKLDT